MSAPRRTTIQLVGWDRAMEVCVTWNEDGIDVTSHANGEISLRGLGGELVGVLWDRMEEAVGTPANAHDVVNACAKAIVETGAARKLGEPLDDEFFSDGTEDARGKGHSLHLSTPHLIQLVMEAAWPDEDDRDVAHTVKEEWVMEQWSAEFQQRYLTTSEYERAVEDHVSFIKECNTPRFKNLMGKMLHSFHGANDFSMTSLSPRIARLLTKSFQNHDGASGFRDYDTIMAEVRGDIGGQGSHGQLASDACMYLKDRARNAETFYITPKMMPVLRDRFTANFGGWQKGIEEHELISPTGMVFFGKDGFKITHEEQKALGVRPSQHMPGCVSGFMWLPCTWDPARVMTIWFLDLATMGGVTERMDQLREMHFHAAKRDGEQYPVVEAARRSGIVMSASPRFVIDGNSFMQYGTTVDRTLDSPYNALAMSVWSLLYEKKVAITGVPCAPIVAKRNKKNLPETGEVNVIYLRTEVARNPELKDLVSGGRHLRYRFKVRSHWQRYHTKEGIIWKKKSESTRGPKHNPDAPYIETDNVYALKR